MFLPIAIFVAVWISAHGACPFFGHHLRHGEFIYEHESDRNLSMAPNRYLLNFKCKEGYTLRGRDYVYCVGYRWSSEFPECSSCSFFGHHMLHGEFVYEHESDRNLPVAPNGYLLHFKCEEGYTLRGRDYVYCFGYRWNSEFPECSMLNCPKPPHVEHSRIEILKGTIQNPIVGSKAIYTCEKGYILNEIDKPLICILEENTARWDADPPSCIASCPDPGKSERGYRRGPCCSVGSLLTYHCRKDYELVGHESIICGRDGKWSAPRPLCKPLNIEVCPVPPTIEHGTVRLSAGQKKGDYYFVFEEVEVVCDPGFAFYGENKYVFCEKNLQWDVEFGECRESYCPRPNIPENGSIVELENNTATEFPHNFELTYICNDGFKLFVDNVRQCNKSKWTGKEPVCEKIHCYEPPTPEDGNKIGDDFSVGSMVKFSCFSGYDLVGTVERYCLPNGQWSGELARCNLKSNYCPNPGVPIKGKKIGGSYKEGDEVSFACESGFKLIGSACRKCLPDHTWSGDEAVCLGTHDFDSERKIGNILHLAMEERAKEQATKTKIFEMELNNTKNTPVDERILDLTFPDRYVLYFLFDVSGSVKESNFNASIRFAKALVKKIGIAPNGARVGAVTFSSKVNIQFLPIHYKTTKEVLDALDVIKYEKGGTATGSALEVVRTEMIPLVKRNIGMDAQLKSVIFLMTDGKANTGGDPKEQGDLLKDEGVEIYCIGITGDINKNQLYDLASEPLEEYVFILKNYLIIDWLIQEITNGKIDFSKCGLASKISHQPKIIGGKIAREPWPWMVALYFKKPKSKFEPELKCGASIINEQWILTAAHCLVKDEKTKRTSDVVIKLGLTNVENATYLQEFEAESFHIHPQYDASLVDYDIALMKLSRSIKYNRYVRPVCLPPKDIPEDSILYKPGRMAFATGWGHDEPVPIGQRHGDNFISVPHLKELAIPIQERSTCANSMEDLGLSEKRFTKRMFCAGDGQGKADTCIGDSGGPLMQQQLSNDDDDTYWTQVGIVSWGMGCSQPNTYGTYTHVHHLLQWIHDMINDYQDEN